MDNVLVAHGRKTDVGVNMNIRVVVVPGNGRTEDMGVKPIRMVGVTIFCMPMNLGKKSSGFVRHWAQ